MATVHDILKRKGVTVVSVPRSTSVLEAAQLMNDRGIGAVLVTDGAGLAGIFTERDVMRRVVAAQRDPAMTPVADVMTTSLATTTSAATVDECASLMTSRRIRHLPVLDGDALAGLVTIGDLMAFQVDEQASTIAQLNSYVYDNR
ncbi:MAG: CBS domain-containing protein [Gemmatimonadota bacterium]|nr:CBS domain-containing protein [Gemmatimonadota bacterium]MDH4349472.1 CBS domain-containing protein [Gemmatimonadota bacterium]MDH5284670.1 CBS domain-containing protein [Gemmatimonadota bacterium]